MSPGEEGLASTARGSRFANRRPARHAETRLPHFLEHLMVSAWAAEEDGMAAPPQHAPRGIAVCVPHSLDHSILDHLIRRIYLCGG